MVLFRYSLGLCSRCLSLSQQTRYLHRSTFLLARGVRRSGDSLPAASFTNLDKNLSVNDDDDTNQMSIQEQFARLELQRLEQQSMKTEEESSSFVDEDDSNQENLRRTPIDPSTTSIILFPGQGTQFVGMG
jgi:hypothetical protein